CSFSLSLHVETLAPNLTLTLVTRSPTRIIKKGAKPRSKPKKADAKLSMNKKRGASTKAVGASTKKGKAAKDPNKPKRPASAFFVFMEEFRKHFNKDHPDNKSVSALGKAARAKWKSLSEAEKAPYVAMADYEKNMKAYNKKQAEGANAAEEEVESEKSMFEVNDDEDFSPSPARAKETHAQEPSYNKGVQYSHSMPTLRHVYFEKVAESLKSCNSKEEGVVEILGCLGNRHHITLNLFLKMSIRSGVKS
ncbi:HMG1/2-like protein, partial [Juglans regia]|uniref:HMG1/2-like protein n=1 Tax=Juglans regia TaxID=51240 RepID=A0A6P9ECD0_JUGRE